MGIVGMLRGYVRSCDRSFERSPQGDTLVMMDNGRAFCSRRFETVLNKWSMLSCAYRSKCNGVVERCLKTIKRMAAGANANPLDMFFRFNSTPKEG